MRIKRKEGKKSTAFLELVDKIIDEMEKFNPFRLLWRERGLDRSEGGGEIGTMKTSAFISPENRSTIRGVVARVRTRKGRSPPGRMDFREC